MYTSIRAHVEGKFTVEYDGVDLNLWTGSNLVNFEKDYIKENLREFRNLQGMLKIICDNLEIEDMEERI